ncbi:MAG: hypothetical protein Q4G36_03070 [Paracoccus sp. (in: a-proteobacteria)]|nr:hypothetical protein [Paracoccus sp. (in: a-proteobacteria)]
MGKAQLDIHLEPDMLANAVAGRFNFMNVVKHAVESKGWAVSLRAETDPPDPRHFAMFHMKQPPHDRALMFRRSYLYPFWHIGAQPERWRFPVALADFTPRDPDRATAFADKLRARHWAEARAVAGDYALIPLQGRIGQRRSFQTMRPLDMLRRVAATGRPAIATLHPREDYSSAERDELAAIAARHPNLTIGGDSRALLPGCAYVATMNSAVAFDGYLLHKPAVLFAQIDFHHIGLNVAELGADEALTRAPTHRPDFDGYLLWFLRHSINARGPDVAQKVREAMKKGGWPV